MGNEIVYIGTTTALPNEVSERVPWPIGPTETSNQKNPISYVPRFSTILGPPAVQPTTLCVQPICIIVFNTPTDRRER